MTNAVNDRLPGIAVTKTEIAEKETGIPIDDEVNGMTATVTAGDAARAETVTTTRNGTAKDVVREMNGATGSPGVASETTLSMLTVTSTVNDAKTTLLPIKWTWTLEMEMGFTLLLSRLVRQVKPVNVNDAPLRPPLAVPQGTVRPTLLPLAEMTEIATLTRTAVALTTMIAALHTTGTTIADLQGVNVNLLGIGKEAITCCGIVPHTDIDLAGDLLLAMSLAYMKFLLLTMTLKPALYLCLSLLRVLPPVILGISSKINLEEAPLGTRASSPTGYPVDPRGTYSPSAGVLYKLTSSVGLPTSN